MELYLAGTDVTASVPLQDRYGNALNATAVDYDVVDQDGNVVVARQSVVGFTSGAASVSVTVLASVNNLATNSVREIRSIRLYLTVNGNTVMLPYTYGIELADPLVEGLNSFQSLAQAELTSLSVPNTPGWDAASESDRIAAMIDARSHLCQLSYYLLNSNVNFAQDSLNYIPEGSFQSQYVATNSLFIFNGNLALLTADQYSQLPDRFKQALRLAQIAEADDILGGDPIKEKRNSGIVLETIGESKQMYRQSKPLHLPASRRALEYLSYFVVFNRNIGR